MIAVGPMDLAPTARISHHPDAMATDLGDLVVILQIQTGVFHQLNQVGSFIWKELAEPVEFAALGRKAAQFFDVDPGVCSNDIAEFLRALSAQGLLVIEP